MIENPPGVAAWPAAMAVWGPGFVATPHRHPCIQVMLSLRGSLKIRGRASRAWRRCGAALISHDAVHEVDARAAPVVLLFVHTESELGVALGELIAGDIACLAPSVVSRWRASLGSSLRVPRVEQWVRNDLLNGASAAPVDPRVRRVLTYVRQHVGAPRDVSLTTLAAFAGLSRSRFMHLFTRALGAPLRPYLRWLRVQRAACELVGGAGVSTAAHRAGFADAAHLNRTFRRMLGMTPSQLIAFARQTHRLLEADADPPSR